MELIIETKKKSTKSDRPIINLRYSLKQNRCAYKKKHGNR